MIQRAKSRSDWLEKRPENRFAPEAKWKGILLKCVRGRDPKSFELLTVAKSEGGYGFDPETEDGRRLIVEEYLARENEQRVSQWVAIRSGDRRLAAELAMVLFSGESWRQWQNRDFTKIEKALDKLFTKKGWLWRKMN